MRRFISPYYYRPGQRGNFIVFGGRIVSVWNDWWGVWVVWYQFDWPKIRKIFTSKLKWWAAGFVDHNRGRHFDRKRR